METYILSTLYNYVRNLKSPCSQNDKLVAQDICVAILRGYWILSCIRHGHLTTVFGSVVMEIHRCMPCLPKISIKDVHALLHSTNLLTANRMRPNQYSFLLFSLQCNIEESNKHRIGWLKAQCAMPFQGKRPPEISAATENC